MGNQVVQIPEQRVVIIDPTTGEPVGVNNGGLDTNLQDSTTRAILNRICQSVTGPYVLASDTVPGAYTIALVDATGLTVGDDIGLFKDSSNPATFFATILDITTNTLTMDTPVDMVFPSASSILFEVLCDMNVNGAVTPSIFAVINDSSIAVDITRVIIHILDDSAMDDGKFGGGDALTRGCVLRKFNNATSDYTNYFNVKTNGEIGRLCFDKEFDPKAPSGIFGMRARLTFAGQSKIGVTVRLHDSDELQLIVQDDLTGLTSFTITAEGHYTDEV